MAKYGIAGLVIEMDVSGTTAVQAAPYLTDTAAAPDIRLKCDGQAVLEQNPDCMTADMGEYMGTGTLFARKLLDFGGFQLHSSAVVLDGKAYLFSAPPGTGKSTHTEKWCRLFGAAYLNDDKPALRMQDGKWYAYGTPWSGKNDLSSPLRAEVGGLAFLHRGEENRICRLAPEEAVGMLISQCLRRLDPERMRRQLEVLDDFLARVPVWRLDCRNDDEAALVSCAAMTGRD